MNKPLFGAPLQTLRNKSTNTKSMRYPVKRHIFDGGGGYCESSTDQPLVLAEGGVVKEGSHWYRMFRGNLSPINYADIPADVKATMLLLQLDI